MNVILFATQIYAKCLKLISKLTSDFSSCTELKMRPAHLHQGLLTQAVCGEHQIHSSWLD